MEEEIAYLIVEQLLAPASIRHIVAAARELKVPPASRSHAGNCLSCARTR
jgi:hypothetical protein